MVFNQEIYWSIARGGCEIFHVHQISNMLILSQNRRTRRRLPFAFGFALGECTSRGLLEWESSCFSIRNVLSFALFYRLQSRAADYDTGRWGFMCRGCYCSDFF